MKSNTFHSKRLTLAPLSENDAPEIFAENRGDVLELFAALPSPDEAMGWVLRALKEIKDGSKIELVIRERDGAFVGMVGVNGIPTDPEIGLWIAQGKRGHGYGKETVTAMLTRLFSATSIKSVRYLADENNIPSIRLAESLGLTREADVIDGDVRLRAYRATPSCLHS